jgi:hypothetical protein
MAFELIDSAWDKVIDRAVAAHSSELRVICPFIKRKVAERLLRGKPFKSIRVLTRFHLRDFYEGVSDTEALRLFLESGAQIRGVKNLHAKLYLFDRKKVVVTSANLTDRALLRNHEFGFAADEPKIIKRCHEYFDRLWGRAKTDLTEAKLVEWEEKLTSARTGHTPPPKGKRWPDYGADCGLGADTDASFIPPVFAEAPKAFVKFFGESDNRTGHASPVLYEVERSGCHWACTYPKGKRPRRVEDGAIMFMARLVRAPTDTMIFGRAVGLAHQDGRDDASPPDIELRPWKEKWPHYVRVHHPDFVAGTLANGVSLFELMDALGSNAFEATKRNAAKGSGNTNPRKALMQQAAVELSAEGFAWLNAKLEEAFTKFGKVPAAELSQLDQPSLTVGNPE